jgi:hypothetical protein
LVCTIDVNLIKWVWIWKIFWKSHPNSLETVRKFTTSPWPRGPRTSCVFKDTKCHQLEGAHHKLCNAKCKVEPISKAQAAQPVPWTWRRSGNPASGLRPGSGQGTLISSWCHCGPVAICTGRQALKLFSSNWFWTCYHTATVGKIIAAEDGE